MDCLESSTLHLTLLDQSESELINALKNRLDKIIKTRLDNIFKNQFENQFKPVAIYERSPDQIPTGYDARLALSLRPQAFFST